MSASWQKMPLWHRDTQHNLILSIAINIFVLGVINAINTIIQSVIMMILVVLSVAVPRKYVPPTVGHQLPSFLSFRVFRNNLKNAAGRGFGAVRNGVNGIGRMADRGMRNFARTTTNGFRRLGGATFNGVERVGNGAGSRIARVGTAARLGLSRMTDAYRRSFYRAGAGLLGVGSATTRGFSNVARTYMRGISRLGTAATRATSRIGEASTVSKRMGEMAADGVSKVAEVAGSVPQGISTLASDKKLQVSMSLNLCFTLALTLRKISYSVTIFSLAQCLRVRCEPRRIKLLGLPESIRFGPKLGVIFTTFHFYERAL